MCGRYFRTTPAAQLAKLLERLGLTGVSNDPGVSYNIAPSHPALAIVGEGVSARMTGMRWGWGRQTTGGPPKLIINARSEELAGHSWTFGDAMRYARCLIPANGYFEWKPQPDGKQPWCFTTRSRQAFCFAGLWRSDTFVILTADPRDDQTRIVHNRVPCIIRPEHYAPWINPGFQSVEAAALMPQAYSSDELDLACWPVSRRVGDPGMDRPDLILPVEPEETLFGRE
ncbi:MAG: SOS response-associated peptidase [Phycisphaerales bacterium]